MKTCSPIVWLHAEHRYESGDTQKSRKDRAQAAFLIRVLADEDPYALSDAWTSARAKGPGWCTALDAALAKLPETAALLPTIE